MLEARRLPLFVDAPWHVPIIDVEFLLVVSSIAPLVLAI